MAHDQTGARHLLPNPACAPLLLLLLLPMLLRMPPPLLPAVPAAQPVSHMGPCCARLCSALRLWGRVSMLPRFARLCYVLHLG